MTKNQKIVLWKELLKCTNGSIQSFQMEIRIFVKYNLVKICEEFWREVKEGERNHD